MRPDESAIINELMPLYDADFSEAQKNSPELMPLFSELKPEATRYCDEELIARGGMKDVSKVFDPKTGRHVAIAKLHVNSPEELYEPFLREARLTALLDHPNIITIHDIGLDEHSIPFFTMELKTGQTLAELVRENMKDETGSMKNNQMTNTSSFILHTSYLKEKSLHNQESLHRFLEIFLKVCDAVSYAHSQNIIHLDLKPDNIQVGTFGEVIVCDWGVGKVIGDNDYDGGEFDRLLINKDLLNNMTLSGEIKGTPGFMALEQIQLDGEKTKASDIYALGAILYTLLTRKSTVRGDTQAMLDKTLAGDIRPAAEAFPELHIPPSLSAVAMKALALNPEDRYKSVHAMRNDIHNFLTGFATSAENAGIIKELKLFYLRNRTVCRQAVASLLILIVLTAWFMNNLNQSRLDAQKAQSLAEVERKKSDKMRIHAEELLLMYEHEKQKLSEANKQRSGLLIKNSKVTQLNFFFEDPVTYTKEALVNLRNAIKTNPTQESIFAMIGLHLFTKQEFKKATNAFAEYPPANEKIAQLCSEWAEEPRGVDNLLPLDKLSQLISSFDKHYFSDICERIVAHDYAVRKNKNGYAQVVESLLRVRNADSKRKHFTFEYNADKKSLTINGDGLRNLLGYDKFASGKSYLRFLNIHSLNISHTKVHDLNQIADLHNLKFLNIRNTEITDLKPLRKLTSLSTLKITNGQFSQKQLNSLPKQIKVEILL